jgi:hypothetical protein
MATPGLRFYRGTKEFIEQVEAALAENSLTLAVERQALVKDGTWDARASQLATLIRSLLQGQGYTYSSPELKAVMERS